MLTFNEFIALPMDYRMFEYPVGIFAPSIKVGIGMYEEVLYKHYLGQKIRLIVRGSSGAIIAGGLAMSKRLNITEIVYIRKEGEPSHESEGQFEYFDHPAKNIIVDDFVSKGYTIEEIGKYLTGYGQKADSLLVCGMVSSGMAENINLHVKTLICGTTFNLEVTQIEEEQKTQLHETQDYILDNIHTTDITNF